MALEMLVYIYIRPCHHCHLNINIPHLDQINNHRHYPERIELEHSKHSLVKKVIDQKYQTEPENSPKNRIYRQGRKDFEYINTHIINQIQEVTITSEKLPANQKNQPCVLESTSKAKGRNAGSIG